jgi:hypothetical protein
MGRFGIMNRVLWLVAHDVSASESFNCEKVDLIMEALVIETHWRLKLARYPIVEMAYLANDVNQSHESPIASWVRFVQPMSNCTWKLEKYPWHAAIRQ